MSILNTVMHIIDSKDVMKLKKIYFILPLLILGFIIILIVNAASNNQKQNNKNDTLINYIDYKFLFQEHELLKRSYYSLNEVNYEENKFIVYDNYNQFQDYLLRENYFDSKLANDLLMHYNEDYFTNKSVLLVEFPLRETASSYKIKTIKSDESNNLTIVIEATGYKQFMSNYFNLLIELETPLNISKIKLEFQ